MPAGVAIAGALLGISWLWAVAVVVYVALVVATFFDADEAEKVGKRSRGIGDGKPAAQPRGIQLADVAAADQDAAVGRIVETQ